RRRDRGPARRRLRRGDPPRDQGAAHRGVKGASVPFIPSRAFVLLAVAPLVLAVAMLFDRTLLWPMLLTDAGIVLVALIDALLAWRPLFTVRRHAAQVFSIGRVNPVTLEVRSRTWR